MAKKPIEIDNPPGASRRELLGVLGVAGLMTGLPSPSDAAPRKRAGLSDADLREHVKTVVVIYAENRSFNNLFAHFPGLQSPLSALKPEQYAQRDRDDSVLPMLPKIWGGLVKDEQVVNHQTYLIGEEAITGLPNQPFALRTPEGDFLPQGVVTRDLAHEFYRSQMQINAGRMDRFVAWGDTGALVMGHYGDNDVNMRLWRIARDYTLCDNFFMGAFGGSCINHQYLIAARPPYYPNADQTPAKAFLADIEGDPRGINLRPKPGLTASALDAPAKFGLTNYSPDFYGVNTVYPPYAPSVTRDPKDPRLADLSDGRTIVPQTHATIGDRLSDKGVDWAWYSGGWNAALAMTDATSAPGTSKPPEFARRPNFQEHHQPFNYFARFAPGTADRDKHLRDGGVEDSPRTNRFLADIAQGRLPAVTYYKPQGNLNMHAGYSDVDNGDRHIATVINALQSGPQWKNMVVIVTFDENGGWWDHVAPPKGDRWGPGVRVPTLIISPFARRGHVDHTIYDTGSISRFLIRRFGLETLPGLREREEAMMAAGGVKPGDLTNALNFA
ncbi:MAG: acid phosphatase [Asticcacaulis sp.]|nr:acid phosphatase [Asticcacaulis sp.]